MIEAVAAGQGEKSFHNSTLLELKYSLFHAMAMAGSPPALSATGCSGKPGRIIVESS